MTQYLYHNAKTIICADFGIDYGQTYERVTFYKLSPPHVFYGILCEDVDGRIDDRTWDALIRAIPADLPVQARFRCLQAVAEYAAVAVSPFIDFFVKISTECDRNDMRAALAFYYEPFEERTCEWMKAVMAFDNRLFQQMVYRIRSGCLSPRTGTAFKRALVYAYWLTSGTTKRVFLDGAGDRSVDVLWKLRRAYEHILFGRFRVDDMTSKYAPLQALLVPSKAYSHTNFDGGAPNCKHLIVKGRRDLTLLAPAQKSFPLHHYRGALELISSSDVVYCDRRLDHHLLEPEDFVFDSPNILVHLPSTKFKTTPERLAMRIADFSNAPPKISRKFDAGSGGGEEFCHKVHLLQPSNDDQYESDVLSVACHVKDFLLWIISENPTLNLTHLKKSERCPSKNTRTVKMPYTNS